MTRLALEPVQAEPSAETRLAVPGMRCAGCIAKLEHGLTAEPGIIAARVDFGAKQVRIAHLANLAVPDLVAALDRLGFEGHPLAEAPKADGEHKQLLSALAVAGFAAMNVMLLSVSVWSGAAEASRSLFHWLSAAIAVPTIAWSGRPFFASAGRALKRGRTNMDVPIAIGVILATAMSLYETATHGEHAWFDGAIMLLFFLLAGRVLDGMMRERARAGAAALMQASAPGAMLLDAHGTARWHTAEAILPGATMLVAAGERLAADGVVLTGEGRCDAAILTGESAAVPVAPGRRLLAGMLALDGPFTVRVDAAGDARAIAGLAHAMADAGQHRSRYVRIADRASRLYAPAVHTLAALTFAGWMIAGAGLHQSLLVAIAVLIITCPCALGLAVPVAQVVASGALMKRGILVKDGSALERLSEANRFIADKTGTLTLGRPVPQDLAGFDARQKGLLLALAQASHHPLSRGLAQALRQEGVEASPLTDITEIAGEGVRGRHAGLDVALSRPLGSKAEADALTVAFSESWQPTHIIRFTDPLRPDARAALDGVYALGITGMIVSGDKAPAVASVARTLDLTAVPDARPEDKLALIERLQRAGARLLMVGDGLNDGPALAAAHVSMAPSSASDVGQQAADLVFMGDSLLAVPRAIRVARATQAVVKQNFALAIGYNILAVPLAMAGLVTPLIAAAAMSVSSLIVVANSLRLAGAAR
ncbi:MAG: heavy metal translocating P-type ATPase [Sphingopyxis sp.]|nr:heavy metal translocating P-type ATPase [Sphingopyxis sp.]